MIPIHYTTRSADVYGFLSSKGAVENIPIVTAATAYTCPKTGQTYVLLFHEFLWFGDLMDHSLINPNQIRHSGIGFWDNPYDKEKGLKIDINDSLTIPLKVKRTKLSFETRVPTRHELDNCEHVDMTSTAPWDPRSVILQEVNEQIPEKVKMDDGSFAYLDPCDDAAILHSMDDSSTDMKEKMLSNVKLSSVEISSTIHEARRGKQKKIEQMINHENFGCLNGRQNTVVNLGVTV